ncbi:chemotaxis protein CheD [Thalassobacillus sp. C254]|uniref:chemotaxis protein CheD n=1 Tax=Thalassobacillus sp. C254 TaxID=1225341 RepID=UPI0006D0884B|nr:chemotaxis protein CheD [Thalassobacillus sp. C254]
MSSRIGQVNIVKVWMADLNIAIAPQLIQTSGLGSCVSVVLYDEEAKAAGMAHIMLPSSRLHASGECNRAKYADSAIEDLYSLLIYHGARRNKVKAKIAGGAQMFEAASSALRIGPRNVEAVKETLKKMHIFLAAEDTGGKSGRTVLFDPATSHLSIRTVNAEEKII